MKNGIYSFNKNLLVVNSGPGTILGTGYPLVNKTDMISFHEVYSRKEFFLKSKWINRIIKSCEKFYKRNYQVAKTEIKEKTFLRLGSQWRFIWEGDTPKRREELTIKRDERKYVLIRDVEIWGRKYLGPSWTTERKPVWLGTGSSQRHEMRQKTHGACRWRLLSIFHITFPS